MKDRLLDVLFQLIHELRRLEALLCEEGFSEKADVVKKKVKALLKLRDRLIATQLNAATGTLHEVAESLAGVSAEIQAYTEKRESADNRLDAVLDTISAAVTLINRLLV